MTQTDKQHVVAASEERDVVLELDELGSLVIDLRTAYDHPAAPEVAAHHLALMLATADAIDPAHTRPGP